MAFEGRVAGERPVALAADVAAHARMDLHVLLERTLGLEALPTQQAEDGHVSACRRQGMKSFRDGPGPAQNQIQRQLQGLTQWSRDYLASCPSSLRT